VKKYIKQNNTPCVSPHALLTYSLFVF